MRVRRRLHGLIRKSTYQRAWRSWGLLVERDALLRRPEILEIEALRKRLFPDFALVPDEAPWKYLDVRGSLRANLKRAHALDLLHECVPPRSRRVLDLGCGAGFFLFICRMRGYDGLGLDVGDVPLYDDLTRTLGVTRIEARIEAFRPLPPLPHAFDVITAFGTVFNRRQGRPWQGPEWTFFLDDLHRRLLPGGRLYLEPNPWRVSGAERGRALLPPEVHRVFLTRGARIDRYTVLFPPLLAPVAAGGDALAGGAPDRTALRLPSPADPAQALPVAPPVLRHLAAHPKRSRRAARSRGVRRALAAAAAVFVLLGGSEVGVRAFAPQEVRLRGYSREGVMVFLPGYRGTYSRAEPASRVEINSDGLRDREYAAVKASDTFRILVLGDALTAGLQVGAEETYPKRLESLLASLRPPGRIEVVNAGISGYGTADELRYLEAFGARWKPDLVVVAYYDGNDVVNNLEEGDVRYEGDAIRVKRRHLTEWQYRIKGARSWIAAHSHLYHFLHAGEPSAGATAARASADESALHAGTHLTFDLVRRLDEVSRGLGARFVLATIPADGRARRSPSDAWLRERTARAGITCVDLSPQVAPSGSDTRVLWQQGRYLTRNGHETAAAALAAFLVREGLVPGASPRSLS